MLCSRVSVISVSYSTSSQPAGTIEAILCQILCSTLLLDSAGYQAFILMGHGYIALWGMVVMGASFRWCRWSIHTFLRHGFNQPNVLASWVLAFIHGLNQLRLTSSTSFDIFPPNVFTPRGLPTYMHGFNQPA